MTISSSLKQLSLLALIASSPIHAILYGTPASPSAAPYTVALISGDSTICAGALISSRSVLTLAECVDNHSASSLSLRVGSLDHTRGGAIKTVAKIVQHPDYNPTTHDANFALLHLHDAVSNQIPPAVIADHSPRSGDKLTLFGWGATDRASLEHRSPVLRQDGTLALDAEACQRDWAGVATITPSMVCDVPDAGVGACKGDEGGPIVSEEDGGKLVALITGVHQCYETDRPDVDADVTVVQDWIRRYTM
ncbi:hypothetical protein FE257_006402 [Aspergillus nanangensis]|uniref:trypsin n=1 Tax=Aspergillus nanangensis TaxID=2582783 RepID=A0AAD4CXZ3_ASPNN|nr:hypothetical protein FE257_006402 [Aspergillus nanangensis]